MKSKSNFPFTLYNFLLLLIIGFSVLLLTLPILFDAMGVYDNVALKVAAVIINTVILMGVSIPFIYFANLEHRLKFKNIFVYIGIAIFLLNVIAISSLPTVVNIVNVPMEDAFIITAFDRFYYLLVGLVVATAPYLYFYLLPRSILSKHHLKIILIAILGVVLIVALGSFIIDHQFWFTLFASKFKNIPDVGLTSFVGHKNSFATVMFVGIVVASFLQIYTKKWWWALFIIPCFVLVIFSMSKMNFFIATLYVLIYAITYLVKWMKKSKDNVIIASLVFILIALLMTFLIINIVKADAGTLFEIKEKINKAIKSASTTFNSRQIIWSSVFSILLPYQYIFGFGQMALNFAIAKAYLYNPLRPSWEKVGFMWSSHNAGVEIIGQGGVIYLAIVLFLYIYLIRAAIKVAKDYPLLSFFTLVFMFTNIIHGLVEVNYLCSGRSDSLDTIVMSLPILTLNYFAQKESYQERSKLLNNIKTYQNEEMPTIFTELNKLRLMYEAKYIELDLKSTLATNSDKECFN